MSLFVILLLIVLLFIISYIFNKSKIIHNNCNNIILSNKDRDTFLKVLKNPLPPNDTLKKAAERFKKRYL